MTTGGGGHFCGATGSTPADWLKNDLTMVMVREKIDYAELFAPRWECFCMSNDYILRVSLLR